MDRERGGGGGGVPVWKQLMAIERLLIVITIRCSSLSLS